MLVMSCWFSCEPKTTNFNSKFFLSPFPSMAFFSSLVQPSKLRKTMEEVWKDMDLQNKPTKHHDSNTTFSGIFLQDLLPSAPSQEASPSTNAITDLHFSPFPSSEFPYLDSNASHEEPHSHCNSLGQSSFCKKRMPGSTDDLDHRRQKRMIKNREAAARSRARKQAYTDELEHKLDHLMKENAKLKKEQQKRLLAVSARLPTKKTLNRASTAPF